jgi:hypothetical protein
VFRRFDCGQVDLARLKGEVIEVLETKHRAYLNSSQERRLKSSCRLLGILFQKSVLLDLRFKVPLDLD